MPYMTVVIEFEGQRPDYVPRLDESLFGGRVSSIAAYDAITLLDEAEQKIEEIDQ